MSSNITLRHKGGTLQPVLLLIPVKLPATDEDKNKFILLNLKTRVGQPNNGMINEKFICKFEEGTAQHWVGPC